MRGFWKTAMAFGLVVAFAGPAMAQGRGGMGGGMGGPANVIGNASVQKELKLDDAQKTKATALATEVREKMMGLRSQLEGLEGAEMMAKRNELAKPINEDATKQIKEMLKPEQFARFSQIEIQQRGLQAFADPVIAKKLSVTDEQHEKVKSIMADMQSEMQEIRQSSGGDMQAANKLMTELRKETTTKVMALMSDGQKKTWKELTGEPFEMVMPPRPAR